MTGQAHLETAATRLLGLSTPILQAPMGELDLPELAAAVSNAGGLGMLGLSWSATGEIAPLIERTRALTQRPFAVNLILDWDQEERLDCVLDLGVKIVLFSWGDPTPFVGQVHAAGALCLHMVGSAAEAHAAVEAGVDLIVAQGVEGGGHVWGRVGTMALVPAVVDAVAPTPVIAAGGIADGRGLAAALALGAAGVLCGTRFLASTEAHAHADYKQRIVEARETDTCYGTLFDRGWPDAPHRVLTNRAVTAWIEAGRPESGARPDEGLEVGKQADGAPITLYDEIPVGPEVEGDLEMLPLFAGQSAGLIHAIEPAGAIVARMTAMAKAALSLAR